MIEFTNTIPMHGGKTAWDAWSSTDLLGMVEQFHSLSGKPIWRAYQWPSGEPVSFGEFERSFTNRRDAAEALQ